MDIRSEQARYVQRGFDRAEIELLPYGLRDSRHNQVYCRTNQGRLVRHDLRFGQYNVLSPDRSTFVLVPNLGPGEWVDQTRPLGQFELLPPLTRWERFYEGAVPTLGDLAARAAAGVLIGGVAGLVAAAHLHPIQFILDHLPARLKGGTAPMPASGQIHVRNLAVPLQTHGNSVLPAGLAHWSTPDAYDYDPWEAQDQIARQVTYEMDDAIRQREADEAFCAENPQECAERRARKPTLTDYAVAAAGGGVFLMAAGMLANGAFAMVSSAEPEPTRADRNRAAHQARVEAEKNEAEQA